MALEEVDCSEDVASTSWFSSLVASEAELTGSSSSLDTSGSCEESTRSEEKM